MFSNQFIEYSINSIPTIRHGHCTIQILIHLHRDVQFTLELSIDNAMTVFQNKAGNDSLKTK